MKPKYTEKIHAQRLLKMLSKKNPCMHCPAQKQFKARSGDYVYENSKHECCEICMNFLGYNSYHFADYPICPCFKYRDDVIKRTWLALEAKGYI
ncbi:MAG: hypothetical protein ABIK30_05660 [bacterium]